ncbi:MAG: hypothetical protein A3F17_03190 [Gammaproteobacteria bacterium RIFCSPHIGHO2_12_FULL_41_15]|nr:MAG: hypothetical protein A3F17_03190 [Gammaproteobacteria bacterium RIFCSPHIGHO2_12_FULL_41_15]
MKNKKRCRLICGVLTAVIAIPLFSIAYSLSIGSLIKDEGEGLKIGSQAIIGHKATSTIISIGGGVVTGLEKTILNLEDPKPNKVIESSLGGGPVDYIVPFTPAAGIIDALTNYQEAEAKIESEIQQQKNNLVQLKAEKAKLSPGIEKNERQLIKLQKTIDAQIAQKNKSVCYLQVLKLCISTNASHKLCNANLTRVVNGAYSSDCE